MNYIIPGLILLFCAPAVFMPTGKVPLILWIAGISLAVGSAGYLWAMWISPNFFVEHPGLVDTPLNPEISSLMGGILFLFGIGLFLALGCRSLLISTGTITRR